MTAEVVLYVGEALGKYGFPNGHPFGPDRQDAFWKETVKQGLDRQATRAEPRPASRAEIECFHTADYLSRVEQLSALGHGMIDYGDTPAYPGVYDASSAVVGAALEGLERVMGGDCYRTFQPIGGLHDSLAGDPLAHLKYSPAAHAHAARSLCQLANELAQGRIMGFGGGGYDRANLALAWNAVLKEFITGSER